MSELGISSVTRARRPRTTIPDAAADRPTNLACQDFTATRPNQLWVADFAYVSTWARTVYAARLIVGWRAATKMTTHWSWTRRRLRHGPAAGRVLTNLAGLVSHTESGQYTSIAFTQRLVDEGVDPSVESVGGAHDNALAESQIGLYSPS